MTIRSGGVEVALNHSGRKSLPTMQRQPAEFQAAREGFLNVFPDVQFDFRRMTWLTFKNGVIAEGWDSWNLGRLLESLK